MKKSLVKKSKKGFTLIELVVVIAILGILAAILIPVIAGFIQRANEAADGANARNLFNSTAMYLATGGTATDQTTLVADNAFLSLAGAVPTPRTAGSVTITFNATTKIVSSVTVGVMTYNSSGNLIKAS